MLTREYTTHSQSLNSDQLAMRRSNILSIFSVNEMFKESFSQNSESFHQCPRVRQERWFETYGRQRDLRPSRCYTGDFRYKFPLGSHSPCRHCHCGHI